MNNISPIDGRYKKYTQELNDLFSETAFIRARVIIELKYFRNTCKGFQTLLKHNKVP